MIVESYFLSLKSFLKGKSESKYYLNDHILKTIISIGSNIAEGNVLSDKSFIKHLNYAIGSCNELKFQFLLINVPYECMDLLNKIMSTCYKLKNIKNRISNIDSRISKNGKETSDKSDK